MKALTLVAPTLAAIATVAAAQPASFEGSYRLSGSFADGQRTQAELSVRRSGADLILERVASTPQAMRWTALGRSVGASQTLRVIYRVAPASGLVGALSGSAPSPSNLFLATYRFEQGQLTESVINFTRRGGERWIRIDAAERRALPPRIQALRDQIVAIAAANTRDKDSISSVRAQLQPLLDAIGAWYADNRPVDEVALTQGAWKSLWYDDPDIEATERFAPLDRENVYQVVRDGFYYNVSNATYRAFGLKLFSSHAYLKGNYTVVDPASASTRGQPRRNVIKLEFDKNRLRFGKIPTDRRLIELVEAVDDGDRKAIRIPGPRGVTGELWNIYLDEDVRISLGVQDDNGVQDVYILRRTEKAGPLPPLP